MGKINSKVLADAVAGARQDAEMSARMYLSVRHEFDEAAETLDVATMVFMESVSGPQDIAYNDAGDFLKRAYFAFHEIRNRRAVAFRLAVVAQREVDQIEEELNGQA